MTVLMPAQKGIGNSVEPSLASIVITTRARRHDALRAVASCFAQDYPLLEVLVFDDASGDGTAKSVKAAFPQARVFALPRRAGLIGNRNRGFREARGKYVFSLDDDAYFSRRDIVSRTAALFERDPTIGAVALPYIEPLDRRSHSSLVRPLRSKPGDELKCYVACAAAVRRDVALALGGYRDFFVRQNEEADFCLRIWALGARVVYGDSGYIVHTVSPRRDRREITYYGGRNQILLATLHVPYSYLPMRLIRTVAGALSYRFSWSTIPLKVRAIAAGIAETVRRWPERKSVGIYAYRAYRRLPEHGPEHWQGPVLAPCHEKARAA